MSFLMDKSGPHGLYYETEEEKKDRIIVAREFENFQAENRREREQLLKFSQEVSQVVSELRSEIRELKTSNEELRNKVTKISRKYPSVDPGYVSVIIGLVSNSVGATWITITSVCYIIVSSDYTVYLVKNRLPKNVYTTLAWSLTLYLTYAIYTAYSNFSVFSTRVASTVQIQSISVTMDIVNKVGTFFAEVALDAKTKYEVTDVLQDAVNLGKKVFDVINGLIGHVSKDIREGDIHSQQDIYNTTVLVPIIKKAVAAQLTDGREDMKLNDFISTALTVIIDNQNRASDSVAVVDYGKILNVNHDLFDGMHSNQAISKIVDGMTKGLIAVSESSSIMGKAMPLEKIYKLRDDLTSSMKEGSVQIEKKIDELQVEGGEYLRTSIPGADYLIPLYRKFNLCDESGRILGMDRSCTLFSQSAVVGPRTVTISVEANFLLLYVLLTNLTWQPIRAVGLLTRSAKNIYEKSRQIGGYVSKKLGLIKQKDEYLIETLPGYLRVRSSRTKNRRKSSRGGKRSRTKRRNSMKRSRRR